MSITRHDNAAARIAGTSLLLAAIGFIVVFSLLAASFDYPDVLDRPAGDVLPRLLALGTAGRATWAIYAAIPLLLIPAAAGLTSLHDAGPNSRHVRVARLSAILSALCMTLGLVRWPTLQWTLAEAWVTSGADAHAALASRFDIANLMLGRYIGEFFGELFLNTAFVLFSVVAWSDRRLPRWVSAFGIIAGGVGLVAMWRNATSMVSGIAEVNNAILPLWLIVWGLALLNASRPGRSKAAVTAGRAS